MLGGRHDDAVVRRIRDRIARFSGYPVTAIEPLQVVRYERGQKYASRSYLRGRGRHSISARST
jgi:hypothetical protein